VEKPVEKPPYFFHKVFIPKKVFHRLGIFFHRKGGFFPQILPTFPQICPSFPQVRGKGGEPKIHKNLQYLWFSMNKRGKTGTDMKKLVALLGALVMAFLVMLPAGALEIADIPDLPADDRTWVVDFANIISSATEGEISRKLDAIQTATGKSVRFVTVPRIDFGQPAQEFLQELFAKWFPTGGEDQALVLIVGEDHRTAWQAGEGIKAVLSPALLQSVIEETMLPPVRSARFNQALQEGAKRLLAVLAGEPDPGPPPVVAQVERKVAEPVDAKTSTTWVLALLAGATIVPMATYFLLQNK
jgi:uncharacterized protein